MPSRQFDDSSHEFLEHLVEVEGVEVPADGHSGILISKVISKTPNTMFTMMLAKVSL